MTSAQVNPSQEGFVLPASFAQQRLWFLDQLEPDGAAYNVPLATRLRGPLDVDALGQALHELAERHETLRTAFTVADDVPQQLIMPSASLELQITDLSAAPDAEQRAATFVNEEVRQAFDLSNGPLMRASILRMGPEDHVLLLTAHHIIVDAWSMSVLNRELSALYGGFVDGVPAQLPELPIQYGDYAVWQQEWMRSGGLDQQLDYWKGQLAGAPALLELPTDHPRPVRQSFRGTTVRTMLPVPLLERVKALGEREGTTLFMTLLGVFAALMSRYSGQEEVVVASPVANRNRAELEGVIGLLVNTLALRVDLDGDPSFNDVLARVRETALGAFSNQDLPFEKLVEELNPERHLSHAPVAQVLFVLQNAAERRVMFPGLAQERLATDRGTAKFDLSFFAAETPEGLRLSLEYCSDLFEEATAMRMLEQYQVLLEAAIAEPARPVGELGLLSEGEDALILGAWNDTSREYPSASLRPVHELVAAQAARTPDLVAVQSGEEELSYAELDSRANRLAGHLRELGVGPDVVVAICAERSVEMVVGVLAALKAGGAYAPIDPNYPEDRLAFMLGDTGAPVLLTQQHLLDTLPAHRAHTVCLDSDWELIAARPDTPPESGATLENLAYVIYTSGSTGRPKGVAMDHRPLANLLAWQLECWSEHAPARTLQFASLSFDVAFQELFSTLSSGGTLVLIDEDARRDPEALLTRLDQQQVQRLFLPFVALQNLCEAAEYLNLTVPSLREVITAGEQLKTTGSIRGFFAKHPDCTLVNQYGPTESHVVTAFPLTDTPEHWPALPPIGRPIANAKIYLLDRHHQPVPIGVPGELHIGGVSLARGYLGRPEMTSEKFLPDPFNPAPARLYRTGDLARYLPDGNIEFLGRADHQVKIRGFRIEPGEIENALREHPAVRETLVIARQDSGSDKRLVAYLISDTTTPTATELRDHLHRSLPDYMIPSAFVTLDAFPLTPNGKINRTALPSPEPGEASSEQPFLAPRTATEQQLATIWKDVLGVERISVHEDFFELGGHSLMAVRLFSEIERKLGVRLPLSALFETATIAGLADLIRRDADDEPLWSSMIELSAGGADTPLFLVGWAGGEVLPYRDLVRNLDSELPVYGLLAPGVDRRTVPLSTVEDLATHYLREIRRVQPHGPYNLGGFCFSGLVAYEMAGQLLQDGEDIGVIALIDSYPFAGPRKRRSRLEVERTKFNSFKQSNLRGKSRWVRTRAVEVRNKVRSEAYLKSGPRLFEALTARNLAHWLPRRPWNLVLVASNLARRRYVLRPLPVKVQFFRAQTEAHRRPTPWEGVAGEGVELREIVAPGIDHDRMMHEPYVQMLASELTQALRNKGGSKAAIANGSAAGG